MNYNSSINQEIKGKLVGREVYQCCSTMISELSKSHEFGDEVLELFYSNTDWERMAEDILCNLSSDDKVEIMQNLRIDSFDEVSAETLCNYLEDKSYVTYLDYVYSEPYEFWIVSDWFGKKLKEHSAIVEEFMGFTIWGRETTGQAILLDGIISRIAEDMEILEGQENSWEKLV